jgi:hypothetical protein
MALVLCGRAAPACGQIFVSNEGNANTGVGTVGRYSLAGAAENASLITGLTANEGIVVAGTDLYVSQQGGVQSVGRYTTAGGTVNASLVTSLNAPTGLDVSGSNLYISNYGGPGTGSVGVYDRLIRLRLDSRARSTGSDRGS